MESKKIGVLFIDEPKTFTNPKTGEEVKLFTGYPEEGEDKELELVAYVNKSKTGKKYLSIYVKPKYKKQQEEKKEEIVNPDDLNF